MDQKWGLLAPIPLAGDIIPRPHVYMCIKVSRSGLRNWNGFVCVAQHIKSFGRAFSKARGVQGQRLWSLVATSETP
ncbi:MAG: hypothetical protein IKI45_08710, partial [Oscillospiraceae bacterium]|nr:hypothetical protein [Oscillospiraceae bacterium]